MTLRWMKSRTFCNLPSQRRLPGTATQRVTPRAGAVCVSLCMASRVGLTRFSRLPVNWLI